ncbi:HAD superfamily hydrolase (TIGR01484 family) [Microbacteriaceae bacterium SG_E_30_P1]|uniref:HAD superfamily hydrolase (TIGR01484 family) n=1 Tax=Antiquaquibacter oligotrophicus TaxID=2880260 RepID=A0ABT6KQC1_9MICO|nr:HAD-IIB family hydrolase [Antiquaquibacter oligotrophicus]MDH6182180.1 HAD superfamily hydrolase (TIGR01484 family) [Antiquaquibacter oligotrophicus]UDF12158.1 HAD family hydrolase [Antiquaquibacter oligotrophicus]
MTSARWLVALDIDGTVLHESGHLSDAVTAAVRAARDAGHEVTLATGRSVAMTLPILERLEIRPEYVVCSNGAITLRRDPDAVLGYSRFHVESFNPAEVLTTIRDNLPLANYAVEDEEGHYRYTGWFPDGTLGAVSEAVEFDRLLEGPATRVVVISPGHAIEDFLSVVERMGLHKVSYNVGWTAWLDIAPDGVNKATALERVRELLGIPRSRVLAVGDGRNDIDMLSWAAAEGRGVAMGQAPDEVVAVASEVTGTDLEDGVASVLAAL